MGLRCLLAQARWAFTSSLLSEVAHPGRNPRTPGHPSGGEDSAAPTELCPECWQVQPVTHIHLGTAVLILALASGGPLQPALAAHCSSSLPCLFPARSMDGHFAKVITLCGALEPRIHLDPVIIVIMIIINKAGILGGHLF